MVNISHIVRLSSKASSIESDEGDLQLPQIIEQFVFNANLKYLTPSVLNLHPDNAM